jgi:diguanylate cyclase (GGDEF)-like protein
VGESTAAAAEPAADLEVSVVVLGLVGLLAALVGPMGGTPAAATAVVAAAASTLTLVTGRRRIGPTLAGVRHALLDPVPAIVVATLLLAMRAVSVTVDGTLLLFDVAIALAAALALAIAAIGLLRERVRDHAAELGREAILAGALVGTMAWIAVGERAWVSGRASTAEGLFAAAALGATAGACLLATRLATSVPGPIRWFAAAPVALLAALSLRLVSWGTDLPQWADNVRLAVTCAACALTGMGTAHRRLRPLRTAVAVPPTRMGLLRLALVLVTVLLVPGVTMARMLSGADVSVPSLIGTTAVLSVAAVAYVGGLARDWGQLERRIRHDELTGLPNRRYFIERLAAALSTAHDEGTRPAVLFLDLDRFKVVNDSLGHDAGNTLLVAVAGRIEEMIAEGDLAARLSGDEFAVLLPDADEATAVATAKRIIAHLSESIDVHGRSVHAGASVGVARYPLDGTEPDAVLRAADTAMYRAKQLGRGRVVVHSDELRDEVEARFALETDLHNAVEEGQLRLAYQPRVDLASGEIVGAEALLRWHHPRFGPVPPSRFIPIAEETNLICSVGRLALEHACAQLARWQEAGYSPIVVSVNLSARQFELESVPDLVAQVLRETGADASWLELELTESVAQHDVDVVSRTIDELAEMGVRCSIDDFGTGYSGLSYLGRFRLSALKIDKGFVQAIDAERGDGSGRDPSSVVAAVIALGRSFGVRVIGEGVETLEQLGFLVEHGCDEIQGHLFSPPLDTEAFESLVMLERIGGVGRLDSLLAALPDAPSGAQVIELHDHRLRASG